MVPALVLTAGLATRLRPLSFVRAKAALPVAGIPIVRRILTSLASAGITNAVLNLHHLPHTLTAHVGDGSDLGIRVRYSWETPVLGSAGGPRRALPLLGEEGRDSTFLIVNGDTLTNVDLVAVVNDHRRSGALVTMAVVPNTEPDKYGGIDVGDDGVFRGFVARGSTQPSWHFIGVQAAESAAFASVPADVPHDVLTLYPALTAARPGSVRAYRTNGVEFFDIGTPSDYLRTSQLIAAREGVELGVNEGVWIENGARVEESILWNDVVVGAGSMLRECVVTDGVRVPADTSWRGVTMRVASGELGPGERQIEGLAIGPLDVA
ncbi:MAG TPA: NDP-sugar synthase [Vicinamibacterales bacterium]|jgi:NDP-sugar pyrophosphorylase family protein